MEAYIDESGVLNIKPGTGTERYALKQWRKGVLDGTLRMEVRNLAGHLEISTEAPPIQPPK